MTVMRIPSIFLNSAAKTCQSDEPPSRKAEPPINSIVELKPEASGFPGSTGAYTRLFIASGDRIFLMFINFGAVCSVAHVMIGWSGWLIW
jgi:hypothetical protein